MNHVEMKFIAGVFGCSAGAGPTPPAIDVKSLYVKIGELTPKNDS
jgi:hypothetical protein